MVIIGRSPRGAPHSASSPGRLTAGARPEIDDVSSVQTVSLPRRLRVTLRLRTWAHFIQTTQRSGFCAALGVGGMGDPTAGLNGFLPPVEPNFTGTTKRERNGRGWRRNIGFTMPASPILLNFGLTSRHQPGSDSRRECPEWRESSCLPHAQQHGEGNGQEAGKVSQGFGNV